MAPQDLLLEVFCLIDDELEALRLPKLRGRGPRPTLTDAEVITIELVGEFWGLDRDAAILRHFRAYHRAEFPDLARVSRTTFARQAANLWWVKDRLRERLAGWLSAGQPVWLVDSLPVEACKFARARFCQRLRGLADYGYDHGVKRTFYGFRLHVRASRDGVILGYELAPARASEKAVLPELAPPAGTVGIADRGYYDPHLRDRLAAAGVDFRTPYLHASRDPDPAGSRRLSRVRYRVETVQGQLAGRYNIKRMWARDRWHACHRVARKVLRHTVMIGVAVRNLRSPLSFAELEMAA
jgi:hypothetical protein